MQRCLRSSLAALVMMAAAVSGPAWPAEVIRDAEIERTLKQVSAPVVEAAGLAPDAVDFLLIKAPELNAFVVGGRTIVINSGLIMKLERVEMFQAVIAHELSHIVGGHLVQRSLVHGDVNTAAGLGFILGLATAAAGGGSAGFGIAVGTIDAARKGLYAFSRSQETSADRMSVRILADAGIDPQAAIDVLELLDRQEPLGAADSRYLRTHPLSAMRIGRIRTLVDDGTKRLAALDPAVKERQRYWYARARAKFRGFLGSASRNVRELEGSGRGEIATLVRAISHFRLPDFEQALAETDRLLELRPGDPFYHELKAQFLLESGRIDPAVRSYRKAASLAPEESLLLAGLGRAQLATNESGSLHEALATLERAYDLDSRDSRMLRDLAIAHQRLGNQGMAALVTAERYALETRFDQAAVHADRAYRTLPRGSPEWQRARDILLATERVH
ncbi:MAG: M48 family metalloprotease [Paracoccaceae bacterium]|nr:M48 family metalloprotease [Paracoccaceae bacterium]